MTTELEVGMEVEMTWYSDIVSRIEGTIVAVIDADTFILNDEFRDMEFKQVNGEWLSPGGCPHTLTIEEGD